LAGGGSKNGFGQTHSQLGAETLLPRMTTLAELGQVKFEAFPPLYLEKKIIIFQRER
jgi:hypothetical protein